MKSSAIDRSKRTGPMQAISKLMKQTGISAYDPKSQRQPQHFVWENQRERNDIHSEHNIYIYIDYSNQPIN